MVHLCILSKKKKTYGTYLYLNMSGTRQKGWKKGTWDYPEGSVLEKSGIHKSMGSKLQAIYKA